MHASCFLELSCFLLVYRLTGLPRQFNWSRLRSLSLELRYQEIEDGIALLKDFHHLTNEVTVKIREEVAIPIVENPLIQPADLSELERTLLGFPQAQLVWVRAISPIGIKSFWVQDVENLFPALSKQGALTVVSDEGDAETLFRFVVQINLHPLLPQPFARLRLAVILPIPFMPLPFLRTVNGRQARLCMASPSGASLMEQWSSNGSSTMAIPSNGWRSLLTAGISPTLPPGVTGLSYGTLRVARRESSRSTAKWNTAHGLLEAM